LEFTAASESLSDDIDNNILTLGSENNEITKIDNLRDQIEAAEKNLEHAENTTTNKNTIERIKEEIEKLKSALSEQISANRISNYGRFIQYLYENKRLFSVTLNEDSYKRGVWDDKARPVTVSDADAQAMTVKSQKALEKETSDEGYLDVTPDAKGKHTIGYFFLGDLLNYAAYALVDEKNRKNIYVPEGQFDSQTEIPQSAEVILGNYSYPKYPPESEFEKNPLKWINDARSNFQEFNLSELPVAYSLYHSFVRDTIVNFSGTVMTFDYFIKQAVAKLIVAAMDSAVKDRKAHEAKTQIERKGPMQIVRITGKADEIINNRKQGLGIDLDAAQSIEYLENSGIMKPDIEDLLLRSKSTEEPLSEDDFPTNWIILHGSRKPIAGSVGEDPVADADRGIYHLVAGSRSGIVKNIDFKQTSTRLKEINLQKYLKSGQIEAGDILRMPYDADVKIFGNPGFYPGQLVWVRPSYVGLGDLNTANSLAGRLGLGGLYNIIGVSTRISPGSLETTLTCIQNNNALKPDEEERVENSNSAAASAADKDNNLENKE
jgi:hypothetical protein